MAMPKAEEMFTGQSLSRKQLTKRYDEYLDTLTKTEGRHVSRDEWLSSQPHVTGQRFDLSGGDRPRTPMDVLTKALSQPELTKAMSAEALASLTAALDAQKAQIPDLVKDLTLTSPVSTGIVAYDLEPGAKMLTPKPTPLRNRIPRRQGFGLAHEYFRITGFTGTGTGGVGVIRPGIGDTTQTNFAPASAAQSLYYARGPKISYAGDHQTIPYVQMSASDQVAWSAQYSGRNQLDLRALSRNALIWASMLLEERVLLYGRGTKTGFAGTLAAPTSVSMTARSATGSEAGISGVTTNVYAYVVAELGDYGVSQASSVANVAASNGQVIDITYTLPAGATGAKVFLGTGAAQPANTAFRLYTGNGSATSPTTGGRSGYNKLVVQGALPTATTQVTAFPLTQAGGGTVDLTGADGGSAYVNEYDGILTYATGSNAGYTTKINGVFSNTNPGVEYQTAFASMYEAVKADPDRVLFAAVDRKQLSDTIKGSSNSNYGIRLMRDDLTGVTLGSVAASILNESTGKELSIEVHPWLPQGNSLILSDTLPIPDTQVDSVLAVYNVQDLMGIDWPVNQFQFEASSYWYGTLVCYAPAWLGSVTGIQRV